MTYQYVSAATAPEPLICRLLTSLGSHPLHVYALVSTNQWTCGICGEADTAYDNDGHIKDCEAFDHGLFERMSSCVPAHTKSLALEWQARFEDYDSRAAAVRAQDAVTRYSATSKPLPLTKIGSYIPIQNPISKSLNKMDMIMGEGTTRDKLIKTASN